MTYEQTTDYLFTRLPAYHQIGKSAYKGDLSVTVALDEYSGNPHRKYHTIHVAGTNGKGSVSHMIASVLQEAGYRTGLYTSPHLRDFRERIRINGEMISENSVIEYVNSHKVVFEKLKPSFFEMTTAMAFDFFADSGVEVAVIEVGLGGRLDSTNIINPVLSVITNIGHDHMDLLGDTLEKVAGEKAGIIKRSVPVVISETQPLLKDLFIAKALGSGSAVSFADERFSCGFGEVDNTVGKRRFWITDLLTSETVEGETVLCGDYQAANLKAVFCVMQHLKDRFRITALNISDGIRNVVKNTGLTGRWQILGNEPLIICDTAHNKEGLEKVIGQIKKMRYSGLHMILGFVNDKDLNIILPLFPEEAVYYFTKASIPRALDEKYLKKEAARYGLIGDSFSDVKSAILEAGRKARKSDIVFIGGSTFIVADAV
jgi:dihydrofolate synthase / folylpolyglutamate synthase